MPKGGSVCRKQVQRTEWGMEEEEPRYLNPV